MDGWFCSGLDSSFQAEYVTRKCLHFYHSILKNPLISKLEISDCNRFCKTTSPAPTAAPAPGAEVVLWFHCLDETFPISLKKIISAERAWGSPSSLGMSQFQLGWKTSTAGCCVCKLRSSTFTTQGCDVWYQKWVWYAEFSSCTHCCCVVLITH